VKIVLLSVLSVLSMVIAPAAAAPAGGCFCGDAFEPGMTVHTTVDNPWGGEALPAGSCGMIACSEAAGNAILVIWFNWYNGDPDAGDWCGCGNQAMSPGKGWWVCCDDIAPGCPPERGACCLQGACSWTTANLCHARGGIYFGDGVPCQDVCDCGEGWQHEDLDEDGDVDFDDFLRLLQGWGPGADQRPDEDIDGDCRVGIEDLLRLFEHWGPPPPRGACCDAEACSVATEEDCLQQGGHWWGIGTSCEDVMCVDAPELGAALCNCEGSFRVGDRVTLLRTMQAPGLVMGKHGTAIAAYDPDQGAYPGKITVLWDEWVEARPEVRADAWRNGLWAIHCGWNPFHDRWSSTNVCCEDLLIGEHDIEAVGACCIDGDSCRLSTQASCLDWGGVYAGDGTPCRPEVCDGPVDCACDGAFSVGDPVQLNRHVDWGRGLKSGKRGHVLGGREAMPGMLLIYFEDWRSGQHDDADTDCGYRADMADRLDELRIAAIPCDALDRLE